MDISPIIARMRASFGQVEKQLSAPDAFTDRQAYEKLTREHQRLAEFLSAHDALTRKQQELVDNRELLEQESDSEFTALIEADIEKLETDIRHLDTKVMGLLLPPGENDSRNTIIEIRPAAGGDEAALFAADLFRMYTRFAERQGWKVEVLNISETDLNGLKDVGFSVQGENVYRALKLESGVHRVQRVPTTEASGRIHTSTVTVAVLPEARDVDVQIDNDDLQVDVFRASGAGGQHVNTTDSAVRITHLPTGLVVASQQERSQHRNLEIAMRLLRSRLLGLRQQQEQARYDATRKAQVGTGDRSERIRTYNFPQGRLTDHRINLTIYRLNEVMAGDLDQVIQPLRNEYQAEQLGALSGE